MMWGTISFPKSALARLVAAVFLPNDKAVNDQQHDGADDRHDEARVLADCVQAQSLAEKRCCKRAGNPQYGCHDDAQAVLARVYRTRDETGNESNYCDPQIAQHEIVLLQSVLT